MCIERVVCVCAVNVCSEMQSLLFLMLFTLQLCQMLFRPAAVSMSLAAGTPGMTKDVVYVNAPPQQQMIAQSNY